jgi:hypothetical protein
MLLTIGVGKRLFGVPVNALTEASRSRDHRPSGAESIDYGSTVREIRRVRAAAVDAVDVLGTPFGLAAPPTALRSAIMQI